MRGATVATGALFALLTTLTATASAHYQIYILCQEPDTYICKAWPLAPQFKKGVHDWFSGEAGPCVVVQITHDGFKTPFSSVKLFGGGEIGMECSVVFIAAGEQKEQVRERRQVGVPPRGRYRGQTQSQYLAIDQGGKDEGKAEAHSAADSSRASVSGNSGMGQAQSQSIYDPSCDDCYSGTQLDAASLKKKPYSVPDGRDGYETGQYGGPGWPGSPNGTPMKTAFGSNQNAGPVLSGSGHSLPGTQSYEQRYRKPGEGLDPNQGGNLPGSAPNTFQINPEGSRLGPGISSYGPTQQSGKGYDPNKRDKQGSGLGPENRSMPYNGFGPGHTDSLGRENFPPGSFLNAPSGKGQGGVNHADGRPNQNGFGAGASPGLYNTGQSSAPVSGNGPAITGPGNILPGSQESTIPNGIYNENQARYPGGLGGANQVGEPGRGNSPDNVNLNVRGTGQPGGNWPLGSYIPGNSPYFCCVVGPDGNIIPAGGLPYNRGSNINTQYPNGNSYGDGGQGIGDPRYGVNTLGQDPGSRNYGPTSGSDESFIPGQPGHGNSVYNIKPNIPNNYMQGPGVSGVSGNYNPGSNLRPGIVGYNPDSLAERVENNNYRPGQSGVSKQGSAPGVNGNFGPGPGSTGGFKPGHGGNLGDNNYGPGQVPGSRIGYELEEPGGQRNTGYGPDRSSGSYIPGQNTGDYGQPLPSNYPGSHLNGGYRPGVTGGKYGPDPTSEMYLPGQNTQGYGPSQGSGSYVPGRESSSYVPGQARGGYGPGQATGGYGPGLASGSYVPGQSTGGYRPGEMISSLGPGQVTGRYGPSQVSGSYSPGNAADNYGPGQTSGGYGPGQTSGGYGPGQTSGGYGPGQTSGGYGPGQTSGGYGPGQTSGGYGPGQSIGSYGRGPAGGSYGPGQSSGNYGPGQTGNRYSPGQASSGYDQTSGQGYGPVGRPGDNGRFGLNEPAYGSEKYGGGAGGNSYDPGQFGLTNNYNGIAQNFTDPDTPVEGDDSAAEAIVSQAANGTTASASSKGGNAQTNVHGTYTGSGSFSAQALIAGENKEAESEITGGEKGASSSAQGSGRNNKSQANVHLGSETGSVQTQSLTNGAYHSSNSQVQGSVKGGMADSQARGPGSTSSQAQIGFTPYKDGDKSHDLQKVPFVGGGIASAQSSGRTGQSQSQLHGTFKYGITYNGAAQAGASIDKDAVFSNRLSFDKIDVFDEKEKNINVGTEKPAALDISTTISTAPILQSVPAEEPIDNSKDEIPTENGLNALNTEDVTEKEDETLKDSESRYSGHTHLDHHKSNDAAVSSPVSLSSTRSFQSSYGNNEGEYKYTTNREEVQPDEYDTESQEEEQGEYVNYDEIPRDSLTHQSLQSPRNSLDVKQSTGGNTQHIILGSLKNHDAEITQKNSERPDESKTYQPGEKVPGTGGYTIPIGFTGSVKSVASKDSTYVVGSKESPSQAQTVTLTPGSGRVKYSYSPSYGRVEPGKLRSLTTGPRDNRYVSVSKSVARDLDAGDNVRKQYSHSYYTKSSSCGFFTFTCTMVSGADGKKKVCKPKIPMNPDGTPIRC